MACRKQGLRGIGKQTPSKQIRNRSNEENLTTLNSKRHSSNEQHSGDDLMTRRYPIHLHMESQVKATLMTTISAERRAEFCISHGASCPVPATRAAEAAITLRSRSRQLNRDLLKKNATEAASVTRRNRSRGLNTISSYRNRKCHWKLVAKFHRIRFEGTQE